MSETSRDANDAADMERKELSPEESLDDRKWMVGGRPNLVSRTLLDSGS